VSTGDVPIVDTDDIGNRTLAETEREQKAVARKEESPIPCGRRERRVLVRMTSLRLPVSQALLAKQLIFGAK
jgi:hypothetical protein